MVRYVRRWPGKRPAKKIVLEDSCASTTVTSQDPRLKGDRQCVSRPFSDLVQSERGISKLKHTGQRAKDKSPCQQARWMRLGGLSEKKSPMAKSDRQDWD